MESPAQGEAGDSWCWRKAPSELQGCSYRGGTVLWQEVKEQAGLGQAGGRQTGLQKSKGENDC